MAAAAGSPRSWPASERTAHALGAALPGRRQERKPRVQGVEPLDDAVGTLVPPKDDRNGPLPPLLSTLTVITGLVDAVSYLALGRVIVANMTSPQILDIADSRDVAAWPS